MSEEISGTELLEKARRGEFINGKRLALGDISIGSIVRRKKNKAAIYQVTCFFNENRDDGLMVAGFPPTVMDYMDDIEVCPIDEIPSWMFDVMSKAIFEENVYRTNDRELLDRLTAENERLKEQAKHYIDLVDKITNLTEEEIQCINKCPLCVFAEDGQIRSMCPFHVELFDREIRIQQLEAELAEAKKALQSIWPFIEEDFPNGLVGENHNTCATEDYRKAAKLIEQFILKETKDSTV
jgi:hypothetical protein